ncbi:MAG: AAA family ATPase [Gemmatirosa sp.]
MARAATTTATASPLPERWEQANQRHLAQALAEVRTALRRHVARVRGEPLADVAVESLASDAGPDAGASLAGARPMALARLCAVFGLSPFERDLLLLCAGVELDATFPALCAAAHGDDQRPFATVGLALAALPGAHWSAVSPSAPLRHWRLIDVAGERGLTASAVRIEERVVHFLAGVASTDDRLAGMVEPVRAAPLASAAHCTIAEQAAALWARHRGPGAPPVVQLWGDGQRDQRAIAVAACATVGLSLHVVSADVVPTAPADVQLLARVWEREAALSGSALLVEFGDDGPDGPHVAAATRLVERLRGAALVASRERRRLGARPTVSFEVVKPEPAEQRAAWRRALGARAERMDGPLDQLVSQFNLGLQGIHAATAEAARAPDDATPEQHGRLLWDACRTQARTRLDDLAQRVAGEAGWDALVLPEAQLQILHDLTAHVRQRATVYERWGFGGAGGRGLGISALFAGASGTGKTMAAEVVARELRLDLYRIDLSSVVSKYIGETEKNLRRIFDAAEEGGAILLFDEADALFGKRSEVKDSHDRHANIEVSYLLQRMESYRGLAVLTTNLKSALDVAFLRRIRFIVQFPFPDAAQRAGIWRTVFPAATPTDGLRADRLAQLNVAGGNIRSIALNAAFLAADAGEPVRMKHVLRAARSEYAKLEKPLTDAEIAGWV